MPMQRNPNPNPKPCPPAPSAVLNPLPHFSPADGLRCARRLDPAGPRCVALVAFARAERSA